MREAKRQKTKNYQLKEFCKCRNTIYRVHIKCRHLFIAVNHFCVQFSDADTELVAENIFSNKFYTEIVVPFHTQALYASEDYNYICNCDHTQCTQIVVAVAVVFVKCYSLLHHQWFPQI